MAEIVNLRMARKEKRRAEAREAAEANRVRHGRSAGEKAASQLARELQKRHVDVHRRDSPKPESTD